MPNCHVTELLGFYAALFEDTALAFPALRGELERDLLRLTALSRTRGIHALCKDLPDFGKHFDRCLADGKFSAGIDVPLTKRVSPTQQTPRFLRGLMQLIFDSSGSLREDCDKEAIFFVRQISYLAKKVVIPCRPSEILETIQKFLDTDEVVNVDPQLNSWWGSTDDLTPDLTQREVFRRALSSIPDFEQRVGELGVKPKRLLDWLCRTAGRVTSILGPYNPKEWKFKHGPGAVAERTGRLNKYLFTNWSERLERYYPMADYGFHSWSAWASRVDGSAESEVTNHDPSSRLVAVPKTYGKPRLIAAEPTEHQWCQQNCWNYMRCRIERSILDTFIGFTSQERNQRMALTGSETGRYATLDLSDASDRLSLPLVSAVFWGNPNLLRHMRAVRTQFVRIDTTPFGGTSTVVHVLNKFSTMGSALTFPVETLCFFTLVYATCMAYLEKGGNGSVVKSFEWSDGLVSVFGDDIVVPTECCGLVQIVLEAFGLKVNVSKTFGTGKFRESCGVDAYDGIDVTPVYLRALSNGSPEYQATCLAVRNNFQKKFLLRTAASVARTSRWIFPPVTPYSGVAGWLTYSKPDYSRFKNRWNKELHRWEIRMPLLVNKASRTPICDDSGLLQFFTEDPTPDLHWSSGVDQRAKLQWVWRWVPVRELAGSEPPPPVI